MGKSAYSDLYNQVAASMHKWHSGSSHSIRMHHRLCERMVGDMTRASLISEVAARTGKTKSVVAAVVQTTVEAIAEALVRGEAVQVHGLGAFSIVQRAAKKGRNPRTGAAVLIPTRRGVRFRVAKRVRERLGRVG